MGWSIFIEETGVHQRSLPYSALVGLAVNDNVVWQLVEKLKEAEMHFFGARLDSLSSHLTVDAMLSPKTMAVAYADSDMAPFERARLTREALRLSGSSPLPEHLVAFAQSQIAFCDSVLESLKNLNVKAFAVLSPSDQSHLTYQGRLRKDYSYLFARIFSFLESQDSSSIGTLILDPKRHRENFVSSSNITDYFERTKNGRLRSQRLIPEPLMAGPLLSTVNHAAVLVSTILSWGFRLPGMIHPRRFDLDKMVRQCNGLRVVIDQGARKKEWSFIFIETIRPRKETLSPVEVQ